MSDGEKRCVLCGESCVGKPRIKNAQGQYAHTACVEARKNESKPTEEPVYDDALGLDDDGMDDLLGDIGMDEPAAIGHGANACPGCGQRVAEGAVVCMSCGYNAETGRSISTKSKEVATPGAGSAVLGGAAKVGGLAASPMLPLIGALIGGAIGATIWAAVSYFLNFEIGYIAWGIGGLVGLGATTGRDAETTGGATIMGIMAAIVAIASIAGGKYAAAYFDVHKWLKQNDVLAERTPDEISDEWAFDVIATNLCDEKLAAGETLKWKDDMAYINAAYWPHDYPEDVQNDAKDRWGDMDPRERLSFRRDIAQEFSEYSLSHRDIDENWALNELADIICMQRIAEEVAINWPDPNLPLTETAWPVSYPESIQQETLEKWNGMSPDEQYEQRVEIALAYNREMNSSSEMTDFVVNEVFIDSFKSGFNIIFILLAIGTAYTIAASD